MGVVWRAHDRVLGRDVAIKEVSIPPEVPGEERSGLYERAMREARAAARLGHANAVTVFDVYEEDRHPFIVMELVDGRTLQQVVREDGPLEPAVAAGVGLAVLNTLERAHATGIVHRDVKPGNIMVTHGGEVKLADFGIAAVKDDPRITQTGVVLGSPSYLSPEQARGETATPATDLWSLGAALYFAVEGEPPFEKGNALATVDAVVHEEPRPPQRARGLAVVIERLLKKNPGSRPTYSEARHLLETAPTDVGPVVAEPQLALGTEELPGRLEPSGDAVQEMEPGPEDAPWRRYLIWGAALLLVVAGIVALVLLWPSGEDQPVVTEGAGSRDPGEGGQGGPSSDGGSEDADTPAEGGAVPAGWTTYEDSEAGYQISYPADWDVVPDRAADSNTDFVDPATGAYMRVAWRSPPDPAGAQGAWEQYEPVFADRHASEGYELVGIEEYPYRNYDAALWEYTYGGNHAVNLGFVVGDYGYAMNFQTPAESWDSYQDEFEAFKETFRP
jgi:eukaryotic-like serine/threonine-protein kinase